MRGELQMTQNRKQLLDAYWATIAQDQNYSALGSYYSMESVLVDPVYGPFEGGENIKAFLEKVTADMARLNITFSVSETAAEGDIGWSRWVIHLPDGSEKQGVSVYRFKGDKILYQHDYIGTNELA